ncbi:DUF397 domain-containing protein [Streptomyces coelicoflavus]
MGLGTAQAAGEKRTFLPDPNGVAWRKSSYSNQEGGNCAEVADGVMGVVPVRDSKVPGGPVVSFGDGSWTAFISGVQGGRRRR